MDPENVGTEALVRVTHWLRGIWEMRRRGGPVQQWVDSIPSYGATTSSLNNRQTGERDDIKDTDSTILESVGNTEKELSFLNDKTIKKTDDMTASSPIVIPNSPAITMTCPTSSAPRNRLARDPSLQSDSSHCSSVESLLEWRKADPEAILLGLGFGYPNSPQENGTLSRIPKRFLQPSKLKGIAVDEFLKQQQQSSESLDSASLGYRGLTGSPYVAPSEIVQKIMERLREHDSQDDSYTNTNSSGDPFISMQQDGRLSVLSPDNRQYLERPRSKSPDMRNKRMIIGQKSFAFAYNGDLIEVDSPNRTETLNSNNYQINSNDSTIKSENESDVPNESDKPSKISVRRLAKQLSFDEDNLKARSEVDEEIIKDQKTSSLVTVSKLLANTKITSGTIIPERFDDTILETSERRASDSLYDSKLRMTELTLAEERRMSDSDIEINVQRFGKNDKIVSDRKPALKRQARVSEVEATWCEMEDVDTPQNLPSASTIVTKKIEDYVSKDDTLSAEYDDDKTNVSWNFNTSGESDDSKIAFELKEEIENRKICCYDGKDNCCRNDESSQIYKNERTLTDCCCLTSNSKCWRKMSKVMRRNQKLEDILAKNNQEMAELREKLNNARSIIGESES